MGKLGLKINAYVRSAFQDSRNLYMAENILFFLFLASAAVQFFFWAIWFPRLIIFIRKEKNKPGPGSIKPVSVIICSRNEAANLAKNLPAVLNQDYLEFEVIVVDDDSSDGTAGVLEKMELENPRLRVIRRLKKYESEGGKKQALSLGISQAKYPWLLLTDADCRPSGKDWIWSMQDMVSEDRKLGLGYGAYEKFPGLLNKWIRMETVYTAIQYFSFALWGLPYMGVGRNLIYHRSLFEKEGGFSKHEKILSGDDDLFVNAVAEKGNVAMAVDKKSFTYSIPKMTFADFFRQKSRHLSTAKYYKLRHKILLVLLTLSHFVFIATFFLGVLFDIRFHIILLIATLRWIIIYSVFGLFIRELEEKGLLGFVIIFDLLLLPFYLLFTPALIFPNRRTWK